MIKVDDIREQDINKEVPANEIPQGVWFTCSNQEFGGSILCNVGLFNDECTNGTPVKRLFLVIRPKWDEKKAIIHTTDTFIFRDIDTVSVSIEITNVHINAHRIISKYANKTLFQDMYLYKKTDAYDDHPLLVTFGMGHNSLGAFIDVLNKKSVRIPHTHKLIPVDVKFIINI